MRDKRLEMKAKTITLGIALIVVTLFITCDNPLEPLTPVQNGYGRISVSCTEEAAPMTSARTIQPSIDFDKYEYTFTKAGETPKVETPDGDGFFVLEVGSYTVEVKAYINAADTSPAASGTSASFNVGPGSNAPVNVPLSIIAAGDGEFSYTITYPAGATAEIALQKKAGSS
jgi:hypothetical protein